MSLCSVNPLEAAELVRAFRSLPLVSSVLPLRLDDGTWNEMRGYCAACKREILSPNLRGIAEHEFRGYKFEAYGLCECGTLTRFSYRLMMDGTIVGRHPKTNEWSLWVPKSVDSRWRRAWHRMWGFLGRE